MVSGYSLWEIGGIIGGAPFGRAVDVVSFFVSDSDSDTGARGSTFVGTSVLRS